MSSVIETGDLDLNIEQRVALAAINAAYLATRAFGTDFGIGLHTAVAPFLSQAVSATVSSLQCPYDSPPADVVRDFDSSKNMYLHCLHGNRHCWSVGGHYITCP
jgi:hypothetical protein